MTRRVFFHRGAAVAECRAPALSTDDPASWGIVCERAAGAVKKWLDEAEATLLPLAAAEYDADPDPRKRFGGMRARLCVSCRVCSPAEGGLLSLAWRAQLERRGRPTVACAWGETYLPGGLPLSVRLYLGERAFRALARRSRVPRRRLAAAGWHLSPAGLCVYAAGREIQAPPPAFAPDPALWAKAVVLLEKRAQKAESAADRRKRRDEKAKSTAGQLKKRTKKAESAADPPRERRKRGKKPSVSQPTAATGPG